MAPLENDRLAWQLAFFFSLPGAMVSQRKTKTGGYSRGVLVA
jgi:hypothetical protein